MDLRKLKTLIDLVSESNISELEITEAEGKVRIVKSAPVGAVVAAAPVVQALAPAPVAVAAPVAGQAAAITQTLQGHAIECHVLWLAAGFASHKIKRCMSDSQKSTAAGFAPGRPVEITADLTQNDGTLWRSHATFVADANGTLDLTQDAPLSGDWKGVEPMGLVWSMRSIGAGGEPVLDDSCDVVSAMMFLEMIGQKTRR